MPDIDKTLSTIPETHAHLRRGRNGAVAAFEYTLVALVFIGRGGSDPDPLLLSAPVHVLKGVALLALGVVTGLVASQIKRRMLDSFRLAGGRERVVNTFGQHVSHVARSTRRQLTAAAAARDLCAAASPFVFRLLSRAKRTPPLQHLPASTGG